jgi:hypothetical protein
VGFAVAVGCLAVALPLALSATSAPAAAGAVPGLRVPAAAVPRLTAIADNFARVNGGATPTSVSAVTTTHAKALDSATPGDNVKSESRIAVYLVTMKGSFTGYGAKVPPGVAMPTGKYLSIVIDSRTFSVLDWGLSPRAPAVRPRSLGPLTLLKP